MNMPFVSYAQSNEDVMLWRALRDVEQGFYVDVGASDPRENSVTCAFYERGWSGINIEPLEAYFEKLKQERPRDINLKAAAGREIGVHTSYEAGTMAFSEAGSENDVRHQPRSFTSQEAVEPLLTLTRILQHRALSAIHFLRINVAGAETELLKGLDLERIRPWIIVVRTAGANAVMSSRDSWEQVLTEHRYDFAHADGLNCFYVAQEQSRLKECLVKPPNTFDDFVRWQEWQANSQTERLERLLSEERSEVAKLSAAYEAEKGHTTQLRNAVAAGQAQIAHLYTILKTEQAHVTSLRDALAAQQALSLNLRSAVPLDQSQTRVRLDQISEQIGNVRTQLAFPWIDRALGNVFKGLHETGDRLTGGGIRAAGMRVLTASLQKYAGFAARHPRIAQVPRAILRPFPKLTTALYRLTLSSSETLVSPAAGTIGSEIALNLQPSQTPVNEAPLNRFGDPASLVDALYKTAFGHPADPADLPNGIHRLQMEGSLNGLATQLACSPGFRTRYGIEDDINIKYLTALYKNGLGRWPDLDNLVYWLAKRKSGVSRSDVLVAIATLNETLEKLSAPNLDADGLYHRWIAENDTISDTDRTLIRTHIAALPRRPVISVIMAHPGTSEFYLRESLNSITSQLYPYWELCIAGDRSSRELLDKVLGDPIGSDPRIRVALVEASREMPANAAIRAATGEFVTFLRPADLLPEHALYEVAVELGRHPKADILYGDCDEITWEGQRRNPWFKPGWDPDLLLSQGYVNGPVTYRLTLLKQINSFRPELQNAEFYDLALRAAEQTLPDRICHIPVILYHWRASEEDHERAKRQLFSRPVRERALREYLDRRGQVDAVITPAPQVPNAFRIIWPTPARLPLVSVIIPTRDRADLLAKCAEGVLQRTGYKNIELLIVDNGSVEPSAHQLFERLCREDKRVRLLSMPGPFNYSALNNYAAREANGEVLLLLNNDISIIDPDWLRELVSQAIRPDVGVVGAKLLYPDGKLQHGGMVIGPNENVTHIHRIADRNDSGYFGQLGLARTLMAVTGACLAIRRSVFFEAGGLNETHLKVAFNDVDLCLRVGDLGYRVVWTPFAELFHLEFASRGSEDTPVDKERVRRERLYMRKTWASLMKSGDSFHNPNILFRWDGLEAPATPRRERSWHHILEQVPDLTCQFLSAIEGSFR
jgi:FkbM family methyltransferase